MRLCLFVLFVCLFVCLFVLFVLFVVWLVGWLVGWFCCLFVCLFVCCLWSDNERNAVTTTRWARLDYRTYHTTVRTYKYRAGTSTDYRYSYNIFHCRSEIDV